MKNIIYTSGELFRLRRVRLMPALLLAIISFPIAGQPVPVSADPSRSALESSQQLEIRLENIRNIESELGIYDPSLAEAYRDLGSYYNELGQSEAALDAYKQALQLTRIASGLNSEQQLPILERMIASSMDLSDWQKTDDLQELKYYLNNQVYGAEDLQYAQALNDMGQWKLRVMRENLLDQGYNSLTRGAIELSTLYRTGISKIVSGSEHQETSLIPLYLGKSRADIEIARNLAQTPYRYFEGSVSEYVYQTVCNNARDAQGNVVRNCYNVRRENPRYRDSQLENKQREVNQSLRDLNQTIQNLYGILARHDDIPAEQREGVMTQIREMEVESARIGRSRHSFLF